MSHFSEHILPEEQKQEIKQLTKVKANINELKNAKKTPKELMKKLFHQNPDKVHKPLANLIRRKRESTNN